MYSNYQEAFDNPIKQQYNQIQRELNVEMNKQQMIRSVEENQKKFGLTAPHLIGSVGEYYESPNVDLSMGEMASIDDNDHYTAQGGFINGDDYNGGTPMSNIPHMYDSNAMDAGSLITFKTESSDTPMSLESDDSEFSESSGSSDSLVIPLHRNKRNRKQHRQSEKKSYHTHDYYISRFIDDMYNKSNDESDQYDVYQHVTSCEYCKKIVKKKMSETQTSKTNPYNKTNELITPQMSLGKGDVRDAVVLVVVGVVIIFVLDLFIKLKQKID